MRVLVVLPFAPWPVRVRCSNLWPRVAKEAEVHVAYLDTGLPEGIEHQRLEHVVSMEPVPFSPARAAVRALGALPSRMPMRAAWCADAEARRMVERTYERVRPDVVYVERLRAIPLVEGLPGDRLVVDPTDSLPLFYDGVLRQRGAPLRQRLLALVERGRLVAYEGRQYARAARVIACSSRDAEAMRRSAPEASVEVVANGVDLARFRFVPPARNGRPKVLVSGNFGYWPNSEAANWMLKQASDVRDRLGGELVFAGANPPAWMMLAGGRGEVRSVGYAPDLAVHYHAASAVAAPVRFAVGSQNKVLEGMACGRPVVATPQCAEGLAPEGRASVVQAPRDTFVEALGGLLEDAERQRALVEGGRAYVERHHSWDEIARQMLGLLEQVARGEEPRRAA